jgi:hypothetical protein
MCKKVETMNTKSTDAVARIIVHGLSPGYRPEWKKLPRDVKTNLMMRLGEKKYNNIHDPRFYQDLERSWQQEQEILKRYNEVGAKQASKFDCPICLESYTSDDKTTTLMCGHKFCTRCIMTNIHRCGHGATCPMCRRDVFDLEQPDLMNSGNEPSPQQIAVESKRVRRRLERKAKRQRKRDAK